MLLQFVSPRQKLLGCGLARQSSLCKLQSGLIWCQNGEVWRTVGFFLLQFWVDGFVVAACRVRHSFSLHGSSLRPLLIMLLRKIFAGIRIPLRCGLQRSGLILLRLRNKKGPPWRRYRGLILQDLSSIKRKINHAPIYRHAIHDQNVCCEYFSFRTTHSIRARCVKIYIRS